MANIIQTRDSIFKRNMCLYTILFPLLFCINTNLWAASINQSLDRELIAVVPASFPPYYQIDAHGNPNGFAIDVMNALAKRENLKLKYQIKSNWNQVFNAMKNGEADLIPNVGASRSRSKFLDFSESVETFSISLFARQNSTIKIDNMQDLVGKNIGAVKSNIGFKIILKIKEITALDYESFEQALYALYSGKLDALAYPDSVGWKLLSQSGQAEEFKIVGEPLAKIKRVVGVKKGNSALLNLLNSSITSFILSQEYRNIHKKWFSKAPPYWSVKKIIWVFGTSFAILILTMFLWRYYLIKDKLKTEMKLNDSKIQLEYITSNISGVVFQLQIGTQNKRTFNYISPKLSEILNIDTTEVLKNADLFFNLVHKDDAQQLSSCFTSLQPQSWHGRFMSTNHATYKWFKLKANPIILENGDIMWNGIFIEATDEIQAESQHKLFWEFSTDMLCIANFNGYFIDLNPTWSKTLGYSNKELMSAPFLELVHPEDQQSTIEESQKLANESTRSINFINRYRRKDGGYSWLSWNAYSMSDTALIYAVAHDVTELKNTQQQLLLYQNHLESLVEQRTLDLDNSERYNRMLFEQSAIGLALCTQDGKLSDINQAYADIIGRTIEETKQLSYWDITPIKYEQDEKTQIDCLNNTGHYGPYEKEYIHKDGHLVPVRLQGLYLDRDGETYIWSSVEDVSTKKRNELALIDATSKANAANKAKSMFLANMSHELRTPLHGILSFAQFGISKTGTASDTKIKEYFNQINNSGERLKVLLNDLLDLSKLEAGKMELNYATTPLFDIVESCISEQQALINQNQLSIQYKFQKHLPMLTCDKVRIGQVVMNLLSNAIKFSPQNGLIILSAELSDTTDECNNSNSAIQICISDQGPGIPKDELESIFNKFIQSSNNQFTTGSTGLGLAISKQLIEAHKGSIWCENNERQGASFRILLPITNVDSNRLCAASQ